MPVDMRLQLSHPLMARLLSGLFVLCSCILAPLPAYSEPIDEHAPTDPPAAPHWDLVEIWKHDTGG